MISPNNITMDALVDSFFKSDVPHIDHEVIEVVVGQVFNSVSSFSPEFITSYLPLIMEGVMKKFMSPFSLMDSSSIWSSSHQPQDSICRSRSNSFSSSYASSQTNNTSLSSHENEDFEDSGTFSAAEFSVGIPETGASSNTFNTFPAASLTGSQGCHQLRRPFKNKAISTPTFSVVSRASMVSSSRSTGNRRVTQSPCVFCVGKGTAPEHTDHPLKDSNGIVQCPALRRYNCPYCNNGGGDYAHTKMHCPLYPGK
jgi:hypothetical protein